MSYTFVLALWSPGKCIPYFSSQLQKSSILEMSANTITILYQLSGAEHCSFNLKRQWGNSLWRGSLEGATARITAFCLCIAGDEWGQDKTWKCRDRSANLLWPKQLRSRLTGVVPFVGDANLNRLKYKGEFLSVEFIQKSLPEKSTWVTWLIFNIL